MTRLLVYDTEMEPAQVLLWDLRVPGGYVPYSNVIKRKKLSCVAAKFVGDDEPMHFWSSWDDGMEAMCRGIWNLLDECDATITFNGINADEKWLSTEFVMMGLNQPSPYRTIDCYRAARRKFAFMSNSLAYVTSELGVRNKTDSGGMKAFIDVMNGDPEARARMAGYCKNDVLATEELFSRIKSYIPNLPNVAVIDGIPDGCPGCGSEDLVRRGYLHQATGTYRRYSCRDCGRWSRGCKRVAKTEFRQIAA